MQRLIQQIEFINELDKLKSVFRRSLLINTERYENSAEHSWHFALMAVILAEYYPHGDKLDMLRVLKMALLHDTAEIYAGDTYCYDEQALHDQEERELKAATKLFAMLPADQSAELFGLWHEFEKNESHEAHFARVIDRLNPFLLNYYSGGISWKKNGIKISQVYRRMAEIQENCPSLWPFVMSLFDKALSEGWIIDDRELGD
jgi:putative hydrolase of HD superfamily